jgi:hypothetical protein
MTQKLEFYTISGQLQQAYLYVTYFSPRREKKYQVWRRISSQRLGMLLFRNFFGIFPSPQSIFNSIH